MATSTLCACAASPTPPPNPTRPPSPNITSVINHTATPDTGCKIESSACQTPPAPSIDFTATPTRITIAVAPTALATTAIPATATAPPPTARPTIILPIFTATVMPIAIVTATATRPPPPSATPPRPPPPTSPPPSAANSNMGGGGASSQLLALHNQARASSGLGPLRLSGALQASAQRLANDCAQRGATCSHTGADGSSFFSRIKGAGYAGNTTGENWAFTNRPNGVLTPWQLWMNSAGHRQNILNPAFQEVGFGIATSAGGVVHFVADFGGVP
ncbi:MAG: CAP domain-containing protein [Anaerolineae bacterium]|nr:CAP domain-containing protein [Anaerolineae bacterium]